MTLVPVATAAALLGPALVLFLVLPNLEKLLFLIHHQEHLIHHRLKKPNSLLPQLDQASALAVMSVQRSARVAIKLLSNLLPQAKLPLGVRINSIQNIRIRVM